MTIAPKLDGVPQEVLEHIAFFTATHTLIGPPSGLVSLLLTSRKVYSRLSFCSNHHLYAQIYASRFDVGAVKRRLGPNNTTPVIFAKELPRRFQHLKRIRNRLYCLVGDPGDDNGPIVNELIFLAYTLMLENEGKNQLQLREYAQIDLWLRDYWFHERGASRAAEHLRDQTWLPETRFRSMAMWLFWFLLRPGDYAKDTPESWNALNVLKTFALAAHKYELAKPEWHLFLPEPQGISQTDSIEYFSQRRHLVSPPLATAAILSFLTLVKTLAEGVSYPTPMPAFNPSSPSQAKLEWDCEWYRCAVIGGDNFDNILTECFRPGSVEGAWEGLFTYTEFTAYAALLAGGQPHIIQRSMIVRHRQTWKLREHHLLSPDASQSDSGIGLDGDGVEPLPSGDPLRSYFPTATQIRESKEGVDIQIPGQKDVLRYQRFSPLSGGHKGRVVQDIIITGEGHSAWGQFSLVGRVRPCDGFVSLSKEYVRLKRSEAQLKKLSETTMKERKEHRSLRDSTARRLAAKLTGKGEEFEAKASKEEREYVEALEKEFVEKERCQELSCLIEEAKREQANLEEKTARYESTRKELSDLYMRVFDGPTEEYPEDDRLEYQVQCTKTLHDKIQDTLNAECRACELLANADRIMNACEAQVKEALTRSQQGAHLVILSEIG
ncbi:hypothetical protein H0H92_011471 [Tricholoma furcatifolium]|nr:hypothetical protein H0H92_011471 [Tricholoma furcatifolium]